MTLIPVRNIHMNEMISVESVLGALDLCPLVVVRDTNTTTTPRDRVPWAANRALDVERNVTAIFATKSRIIDGEDRP